jgi:hypothetical protein
MSVRRLVSLLHGLGYETVSTNHIHDEHPQEPLSSPDEVRQFFGGAVRYSGGDG